MSSISHLYTFSVTRKNQIKCDILFFIITKSSLCFGVTITFGQCAFRFYVKPKIEARLSFNYNQYALFNFYLDIRIKE